MNRIFKVTLALLALLAACAEKPISQLSPEEGMQRIRTEHADKNWEKVIQDVNEYRSRYPYTQFAAEAELAQADAYFQSGRYPEAVATYDEFLKKNPTHKEAGFAAFKVGSSYDMQAPEEVDREQEFALKAIEKYQSFLDRFPTSAHVKEAQERVHALRRRVAEHFIFIARFYWKKDLYQGSLSRYAQVIEKYGNFPDLKKEAIERAAESYRELARMLEKDPKSDKIVYYRNSTPAELRKKAEEIEKLK